jgi:4'-phosphopantetheinyl transferase EntD
LRVLPFRIGRALVGEEAEPGSEEERRIASELGEPRRAEFCAGRLAARRAIGPGNHVIGRHDDGAPRVLGHDDLLISITHDRREAVAVVGEGLALLGCDLAELAQAPRIEKVSHRFIPPEDAALPTDARGWAVLWALKEAAAKAQRRGLLTHDGLRSSRLRSLDPPAFLSPELEAIVELRGESVLAIVWRAQPDQLQANASSTSVSR